MPLDELEFRILKFVQQHHLIPTGSKILVALSGGMDSVCLLHVLLNLKLKLGIEIVAAHLNHMIRASAVRDEEFVRKLCEKLNVELHVERIDVPKLCRDKKVSLEEGARIARYEFLEKVRNHTHSDFTALAHNLNDLAETILHRIVRGTGLTGLICMKPKDGSKIRPLLYVSRKEIEQYISRNKLSYVEDESNYDTRYTRNYIRHRIVPLLKEINPDVESALRQLHYAANLLDKHVSRLLKQKELLKSRDRVIFSIESMDEFEVVELLKYGTNHFGVCLNYKQIENLLNMLNESSFSIRIAEDLWVRKGFEFLSVEKQGSVVTFLELGDFGEYNFNGWVFKLSDKVESGEYVSVSKNKSFIRTRRSGDRVGNTKVKDLMIDSKIPEFLRNEYPIVCDGDKIVWIPFVYKSEDPKVSEVFLNLISHPYGCILRVAGDERRKRFER